MKRILLLIAVTTNLWSCSFFTEPESSELEKNRKLWESQNINSYHYQFSRSCFCVPGFLSGSVYVRGDTVYKVENPQGNLTPLAEFDIKEFKSVEQLFALIAEAEDQGAAEILVSYHADLGHPEEISIDYIKEALDDEISYSAGDIVPSVTCDSASNDCDSTNCVILTEQHPDSIQLDTFQLLSASISGDDLTIEISHSGGCKEHEYDLFMSPAVFLESFSEALPVQANLFLRHNGNGDACKALIQTSLTFNLCPIAELYLQNFGRKDEIVLNVFEFLDVPVSRHLSLSYFPD
ncbi:MAG: DUF6174 domain-containing protein [bacterium]